MSIIKKRSIEFQIQNKQVKNVLILLLCFILVCFLIQAVSASNTVVPGSGVIPANITGDLADIDHGGTMESRVSVLPVKGPVSVPNVSLPGRGTRIQEITPPIEEHREEGIITIDSAGDTTRVSIGQSGNQGNADSGVPSISSDGRYVAFHSSATNLIPGDINGVYDVFVHDRNTGTTTIISVGPSLALGNGDSSNPSISIDGRYIAFESEATNLVRGDTNGYCDVFVHDRNTGTTTLVSLTWNGIIPTLGNDHSFNPSISSDGRYIAFQSWATNLVPGDTNGLTDIFVYDRNTWIITRVSVATGGNQGNGNSEASSISSDGRYVAFESSASNLVPSDTNGVSDVFVHDRNTEVTTRVSVATDGTQGSSASYNPSISSDGRYVAFYSYATNLVPGDTNGAYDVFVHDRNTGGTTRVSVATGGTQGTGGNSLYSSISSNGRYVAFYSSANNLVPGDTNGVSDVFVHDSNTGTTALVSGAPDGTQATGGASYHPSISSDGRYVAFYSYATNLVPGDTNGWADIFVHEYQYPDPTITSISPTSGYNTGTLTTTIKGSNFRSGLSAKLTRGSTTKTGMVSSFTGTQFKAKFALLGAPAGKYNLVITNTDKTTVTKSGYFTVKSEKYSYVRKWGKKGTANTQFTVPYGIAIDSKGYIYVADTSNNRILKFSSTGAYKAKWGRKGTGNGQFSSPRDVVVDKSGNVYVADTGNNRIQKFSSTGTYLLKWGKKGTGTTQFNSPYGVGVDKSGYVYVADTGNNRIMKFSSSGSYKAKWGKKGAGNGQYSSPRDVAVDKNGYIYIADTGNHRIQKLSSGGKYQTKWGGKGTANGKFNTPSGIAVDANNFVYVADTNNNRIQKFSSTGSYLTKWGTTGTGNTRFKTPARLAVSSAGQVYIADTGNNRVAVWKKPVSSVSAETMEMDLNMTNASPIVKSFNAPDMYRPSVGVPVVDMPVMRKIGTVLQGVGTDVKKMCEKTSFSQLHYYELNTSIR